VSAQRARPKTAGAESAFAASPQHSPLTHQLPVADVAVDRVRAALQHGIELRQRLLHEEGQARLIATAAAQVIACLRSGGKLLLCGNGGSAADCQHIAAELTGRFSKLPRRGLAALSLTTDTSALSAIANDFSYEQVFSRQVEALGRPGDVLLAISTSGGSQNVLRAAATARDLGMYVIGLTGETQSPLGAHSDLWLRTPGTTSERIQELHITIGHILCDLIDVAFTTPAAEAR
jgi:D-sedoheptulose 7-phosphate isomerase